MLQIFLFFKYTVNLILFISIELIFILQAIFFFN